MSFDIDPPKPKRTVLSECEQKIQEEIEDEIKIRDKFLQDIENRKAEVKEKLSGKIPADPMIRDYFKQGIDKIQRLEKQLEDLEAGRIDQLLIQNLKTQLQKSPTYESNGSIVQIMQETEYIYEKEIPELLIKYNKALEKNLELEKRCRNLQ